MRSDPLVVWKLDLLGHSVANLIDTMRRLEPTYEDGTAAESLYVQARRGRAGFFPPL